MHLTFALFLDSSSIERSVDRSDFPAGLLRFAATAKFTFTKITECNIDGNCVQDHINHCEGHCHVLEEERVVTGNSHQDLKYHSGSGCDAHGPVVLPNNLLGG